MAGRPVVLAFRPDLPPTTSTCTAAAGMTVAVPLHALALSTATATASTGVTAGIASCHPTACILRMGDKSGQGPWPSYCKELFPIWRDVEHLYPPRFPSVPPEPEPPPCCEPRVVGSVLASNERCPWASACTCMMLCSRCNTRSARLRLTTAAQSTMSGANPAVPAIRQRRLSSERGCTVSTSSSLARSVRQCSSAWLQKNAQAANSVAALAPKVTCPAAMSTRYCRLPMLPAWLCRALLRTGTAFEAEPHTKTPRAQHQQTGPAYLSSRQPGLHPQARQTTSQARPAEDPPQQSTARDAS